MEQKQVSEPRPVATPPIANPSQPKPLPAPRPGPAEPTPRPIVSETELRDKLERTSPDDAGQETDVWYGGYAGRALLGSFVLCVTVTAAVLIALWRAGEYVAPAQHDLLVIAAWGVIGALWLFQLFRWGYRQFAVSSRLTTRRLLHSRGFLYGRAKTVELAEVTRVEVRRTLVDRCMGVGRVHVFCESGPTAPVILDGVLRSDAVAEILRNQAARARESQVISAKVQVG